MILGSLERGNLLATQSCVLILLLVITLPSAFWDALSTCTPTEIQTIFKCVLTADNIPQIMTDSDRTIYPATL